MDELLDVLIESGGKMTFNIGINSIVFFVYFLPLEVKEIYHIRHQNSVLAQWISMYHFALFSSSSFSV